MSRHMHGPSLYFATDKNVFDALNQHKVDNPTVMKLFQERNIIVGKKNSREELAKYFSRLTHDYYDHQTISARLGITPRRERITSMDVEIENEVDSDLKIAVDQLKQELESAGDVVQIDRDGDSMSLNIQYTTVDYKRNEFSQLQVRDGTIEFVKTGSGYTVRNTQNEYLNNVRDTLFGKIEKVNESPLKKVEVSLHDIESHKLRSGFFHDLISKLSGFNLTDVNSVYVYKAKPEEDEDETDGDDYIDTETHIERVMLRGSGVTRSEILNELLDNEDYYIVKIGWKTKEIMSGGHVYDIEATFSDPRDCRGFSFILNGVYPLEDGKISSRRRTPTKHEINRISQIIETKSRELVVALHEKIKVMNDGH